MDVVLGQFDPASLPSLLDKYGIPIVAIALLVGAVIVLFKLLLDSKQKGYDAAIKVLQDAVASEKARADRAEQRLDSNTTALREATVGFNAATGVMEKLAGRIADERPTARPRPRAASRD